MRINPTRLLATLVLCAFPWLAHAQVLAEHDHGHAIFHAFRLEGSGGWQESQPLINWEADGWVGDDQTKLWLRSVGERHGSETERAELWVLGSRTLSDFWDGQVGLRQDFTGSFARYGVIGLRGTAPYDIETQAHMLIGDQGTVGLRYRVETDLLITNRLIVKPTLETDLSSKSVVQDKVGRGLSSLETSLQLRYDITRAFAPFVEGTYRRRLFANEDLAHQSGQSPEERQIKIGVRLLF